MNRIVLARKGFLTVQVCVELDATDAEILSTCNTEYPSGTELGWCHVCRDEDNADRNPVACNKYLGRLHVLVDC